MQRSSQTQTKGQKKQALAISGQKLRDVARASGIPIKYDCSEGTCKTCEAQLSPGGRTKICVARMPNRDTTSTTSLMDRNNLPPTLCTASAHPSLTASCCLCSQVQSSLLIIPLTLVAF